MPNSALLVERTYHLEQGFAVAQNDSSADLLAEFSISETGGIDGAPGDQTGRESWVHAYYEAWEGILHYNGKADGGAAASGGTSGNRESATVDLFDSFFLN